MINVTIFTLKMFTLIIFRKLKTIIIIKTIKETENVHEQDGNDQCIQLVGPQNLFGLTANGKAL